jgi:hypothetical protein
MQEEIISNEAKYFLTKEQSAINEMLLKRAQDELKAYVGSKVIRCPSAGFREISIQPSRVRMRRAARRRVCGISC